MLRDCLALWSRLSFRSHVPQRCTNVHNVVPASCWHVAEFIHRAVSRDPFLHIISPHLVFSDHPNMCTLWKCKSCLFMCLVVLFYSLLSGLQLQQWRVSQSSVQCAHWPLPMSACICWTELSSVLPWLQRLSRLCGLWLWPERDIGGHLWWGTGSLQLCRGNWYLLLQGMGPRCSIFFLSPSRHSDFWAFNYLNKQPGFRHVS